jgi:diguanylate cyclase (GGDEF)-like protein
VTSRPDIVLMDVHLGAGLDGVEAAQHILQWLDVPVIFLSERMDVSAADVARLKGSYGFLPKPLGWRALQGAVEVALHRHEVTRSLERIARIDPLTESWNRRATIEILERHSNAVDDLSVLLLDVDRFKAVNDTYGHKGGDIVLTGLAHRLRKGLRASDAVGRWGGEEFVIALSGCPGRAAGRVAERVRQLAACAPITFESLAIPITISVGVATLRDGESVEQLVRRADELMYRAKQEGRDRVCA